MNSDRLRTISFNNEGFTLDIPILDETHFVSWSSIDTIIFGPEIISRDHSEFIIYLNQPPVITLKQDAWWLNKMTFWMKRKKRKKIRMSDEWNRDFSKVIGNAKLHLKNVKDVDISDDKRKGTLIKRTETIKNDCTVMKEQWRPEITTDFKWEMVYDRYNRSVADIYYRDKGI